MSASNISFRNSKVVYYGPHACENCGDLIVKAAREFGGAVFSNPDETIYPNTEWHPHICDPLKVKASLKATREQAVLADWPNANVRKIGKMGYIILGERLDEQAIREHETRQAAEEKRSGCVVPPRSSRLEYVLVISHNHSFYEDVEAAWSGAYERMVKGNPTWQINLTNYNADSEFGNHLDMLPECPASDEPEMRTPGLF